ncbi:MAG: type I 3-dehydroquinate dehydratase [Deltaproteobacteria bacterium]|nr:type I 3-dehydroquinate dehydratase [Deltaproteobacteria bacterium]
MSNLLKIGAPPAVAVIVANVSAGVVLRALSLGADMLELRVDTFKNRGVESLVKTFHRLKAVKGVKGIPILLTVRSAGEGARFEINDAERLEIFRALTPFVDAIDIELGSTAILAHVVGLAKKNRKTIIVSSHDFNGTPADKRLEAIISAGLRAGGDVVKIAAYVRDAKDVRRLAKLLVKHDNLIVIPMGEYGTPFRVFFPALGSLAAYGSVTGKTAPGQLCLKDVVSAFRAFGLKK